MSTKKIVLYSDTLQTETNYNYFMSDIEAYDEKNPHKYVVRAVIQRWDGIYYGFKQFNSLTEAIHACLEEYNTIEADGIGNLEIEAHHHDGTNKFYIKEVKREGEEYYKRNTWRSYDIDLFAKIFMDKHYSRCCSNIKEYIKSIKSLKRNS